MSFKHAGFIHPCHVVRCLSSIHASSLPSWTHMGPHKVQSHHRFISPSSHQSGLTKLMIFYENGWMLHFAVPKLQFTLLLLLLNNNRVEDLKLYQMTFERLPDAPSTSIKILMICKLWRWWRANLMFDHRNLFRALISPAYELENCNTWVWWVAEW